MNNQGLVEVTMGLEAGNEDLLRTYQSQGLSNVIFNYLPLSLCVYDLLYDLHI